MPSLSHGQQAGSDCKLVVQVDGAATPGWAPGETPAVGATPTPKRGRSRWDETPAGAGNLGATPAATPGIGATPMLTPGATPMGAMDMPTPSPSMLQQPGQMTPEQYQASLELHRSCCRCLPPLQAVCGF